MPLLRYLQHWLTGRGPCCQVADFVPATHPLRQWAETFPWAALVAAVDRSFAQRFPKPSTRGRPPVSTRVLLALELLKQELTLLVNPSRARHLPGRSKTISSKNYFCSRKRVHRGRAETELLLRTPARGCGQGTTLHAPSDALSLRSAMVLLGAHQEISHDLTLPSSPTCPRCNGGRGACGLSQRQPLRRPACRVWHALR